MQFKTLADFMAHGFDDVIDVRSPAEFAEDHVPGAISLPVLDNEERARVGTIYKQDSPFKARKLGAALVFRNAARHVEQVLSDREGGWRPLVYCWRGGQRSGSFAWMLGQIGWRAESVEGGYRSFRRLVNGYLYDTPLPHRLVLLDGQTGTAKTDLLTRAGGLGVQVLDLEGLARHRGSLLGQGAAPQPSQKAFETALAQALVGFDPEKPVLVEAESSKIGRLILPPMLWQAMCAAPRIEVQAPVPARIDYLARAYAEIFDDRATLETRLSFLRQVRGHAVVDGWNAAIAAGDWPGLVRLLVGEHYDPAYDSARRKISAPVAGSLALGSLSETALDDGAQALAATLSGM